MASKEAKDRKRICVVGAGAAGIAAAWSLSRHPDKFEVEVWEKATRPGGVATSERINEDSYINDGVQGGADSYRNTLLLHKHFGFEPERVELKVSFGKGKTHWNNYGKTWETPLVTKLRPEIKRFGRLLWWINMLEFVFIFLPISLVLRVFRFSEEFRNYMVYPLTALFFGTGNQTPNVSAAIIARVFRDPDLRLFDYDPDLLLSQCPAMFAFKELSTIYTTIADKLERDAENVKVFLGKDVRSVVRSKEGITILDGEGKKAFFDEVIFACDAETVLKVLDKPSRMEKWTLGNVKYYNDITITHKDEEYMHKHYEIDARRNDQYLIRIDEKDPSKVDMSFILSNYQPQLKKSKCPIYQTIFLDDKNADSWNIQEIREDKILLRKWWRQFAHTWKHFAFVVPFVRFLQGKQHSWFCGAYTLLNTHEIATISGLAVAHRLGATYPFTDPLATKQFHMYLKFIHGVSL